uniref:Uncharacterized protein n=1 Tax=Panagrolaimus sp. ES5 TaxID=591445 RepID=A0AC34FV58_9BILA
MLFIAGSSSTFTADSNYNDYKKRNNSKPKFSSVRELSLSNEDQKQWKQDDDKKDDQEEKKKYTSTLSLHIECYENSSEAADSNESKASGRSSSKFTVDSNYNDYKKRNNSNSKFSSVRELSLSNEDQKQWKQDDDEKDDQEEKKKYTSTLSLHIECYENSSEDADSNESKASGSLKEVID